MRTVYYPDAGNTRCQFFSKEDCEEYEKREIERDKEFLASFRKHCPKYKLEKLKRDLETVSTIPPETIATTSHDCLAIKGMVKVCQSFAEENKEYLYHY